MKILVADDSSTVRRLVAARLLADGYEVIEAEDGEEALRLALSERPDLVVLDKVMPKLDGFEVVRVLREREEAAQRRATRASRCDASALRRAGIVRAIQAAATGMRGNCVFARGESPSLPP